VRVHLDTSVIVRYLTGSPPDAAVHATGLFAKAEAGLIRLFLADVIAIETGFVLLRVLGLERKQAAGLLWSLMEAPGVDVERREVLQQALEIFEEGAIGLTDAYLASHALASRGQLDQLALVASFDRGLRRLPQLCVVARPEDLPGET
jgi:predicted nucleic acid-binding protein